MSLTKQLYDQRNVISMCVCKQDSKGDCKPCSKECKYCSEESEG